MLLIPILFSFAFIGCSKSSPNQGEEANTTNGTEDTATTGQSGFKGIAIARDGYIALAEADGSNERRLTSQGGAYDDLAFSPSGSKLAATKVVGDSMPQLVCVDVVSGKETDLSWTNPEYSAAWSSAGVDPWYGAITWVSESTLYCTAVTNINGRQRLRVVKYEVSEHRITIIREDAKNPALSPDGRELAYIQRPPDFAESQGPDWGDANYGDLVIQDPAGGTARTLRGNVLEAVFTPEGGHLALVYFDEPDTVLELADLTGARLYTLSHIGPSGTLKHPSFSPAGDKLIATRGWSDDPGQPKQKSIFICASSSDNPSPVDLGKGDCGAWSPVH
jgi:Tol biopolymer transport system component